jgi:hypothetical protein
VFSGSSMRESHLDPPAAAKPSAKPPAQKAPAKKPPAQKPPAPKPPVAAPQRRKTSGGVPGSTERADAPQEGGLRSGKHPRALAFGLEQRKPAEKVADGDLLGEGSVTAYASAAKASSGDSLTSAAALHANRVRLADKAAVAAVNGELKEELRLNAVSITALKAEMAELRLEVVKRDGQLARSREKVVSMADCAAGLARAKVTADKLHITTVEKASAAEAKAQGLIQLCKMAEKTGDQWMNVALSGMPGQKADWSKGVPGSRGTPSWEEKSWLDGEGKLEEAKRQAAEREREEVEEEEEDDAETRRVGLEAQQAWRAKKAADLAAAAAAGKAADRKKKRAGAKAALEAARAAEAAQLLVLAEVASEEEGAEEGDQQPGGQEAAPPPSLLAPAPSKKKKRVGAAAAEGEAVPVKKKKKKAKAGGD